jgi:hypothetical protein
MPETLSDARSAPKDKRQRLRILPMAYSPVTTDKMCLSLTLRDSVCFISKVECPIIPNTAFQSWAQLRNKVAWRHLPMLSYCRIVIFPQHVSSCIRQSGVKYWLEIWPELKTGITWICSLTIELFAPYSNWTLLSWRQHRQEVMRLALLPNLLAVPNYTALCMKGSLFFSWLYMVVLDYIVTVIIILALSLL